MRSRLDGLRPDRGAFSRRHDAAHGRRRGSARAFNLPLRGVYELIELLLAATFFFALPCVFLRDENIVVNSIDDMAPRWVPMLKRAR